LGRIRSESEAHPTTPGVAADDVSVASRGSNATGANTKSQLVKSMFFSFQKAAKCGHHEAQFHYGIMCLQDLHTHGVYTDQSKALKALWHAAKGGVKEALYVLIWQLIAPVAAAVGVPRTEDASSVANEVIKPEEMKRLVESYKDRDPRDAIVRFYLGRQKIKHCKRPFFRHKP
jgi:hypothetical protein